MPLFAFEGAGRIASPAAWIAPTATLVGDLRVEAEASVWYEAAAAGVVPLRVAGSAAPAGPGGTASSTRSVKNGR